MQAFGKWGTAIYFMQFLLAGKDLLPSNQVLQIATQLIQTMATELASIPLPSTPRQSRPSSQNSKNSSTTEGSNEEEEANLLQQDATQSLDRRLVACYYFQSLLRLNPFAQSQIGLVAPLWKGICNVHKACPIGMEASLLEQAIQQVLKMLKEGCPRLINTLIIIVGSNNSNNNNTANVNLVASFVMQGKLISFLALRLANLMGTTACGAGGIAKKTRSKAYKQLLLLQGMYFATQGQATLPAPIQKTCFEITTKTTKALVEVIVDSKDDCIHRPALDALIPIAMATPKDENDAHADLAYKSLHLAKVQLVLAILERFSTKNAECLLQNMDTLLVLCESLYAIFLPQCYGSLLESSWWKDCKIAKTVLGVCLKPMANVLVRMDSALSSSWTSNSKKTQLHRLLIRWLAPYRSTELHPLSQQVILTVSHLFLMTSPNPSSLVSLMVKLLFDPRTKTGLRDNLSALFVTILATSTNSNAPLKEIVHSLIETEVQGRIPKGDSKKRPRNEMNLSYKHYSFADLKAIASVLVHISISSQDCLMEAMQQLVQQLQCGKENPKSIPRIAKVEWSCMVLALMRGTLLGDADKFQSKMGMSLFEFQRRIILVATMTKQSTTQGNKYRAIIKHCMLCSAVIRFSTHVCNGLYQNREGAARLVPIQDLCRLLKHCTSTAFLSNDFSSFDPSQQCQSLVLFDAIRLLEAIGFAIPPGCPTTVLDTVTEIFVRLLSQNNWAIVSHTIGSLVCFGQRLDKAHQQILPSCLPAARQSLFRRRMLSNRGQIHYRQYGNNDLVSLNIGRTLLSGHCEKREIGKSIFPATSRMDIAQGSYFLKMSTQEGRHAWVIFEPGPESIQDIKYMNGLEEDDDAPEDIQKLKRALVVENGGLKCLLQSL